MRSPFWRFFAVLFAAELVTVLAALLVTDLTCLYWVRERSRALADRLPPLVKEFDWATLQQFRPDDTPGTCPTLRVIVDRLMRMEKETFRNRPGVTLSIVRVEGERLTPIATSWDEDGQKSSGTWTPADPWARQALQGSLAWSPEPHSHEEGGFVLTAYAPIKDTSGSVKALLRAQDGDIAPSSDLRSLVRTTCLALMLLPLVISLYLAGILSKRFVDPSEFLKQLRRAIASSGVTAVTPPPDDRGAALAVEASASQRPEFEQWLALWKDLKESHKKVALAVGAGLTNAEVAERMCLSVSRVRQILNEIYGILGITSGNRRATLAVIAASMGGLTFQEREPGGTP